MCVYFILNEFCSFSVRKGDVAVQLKKQKGIVMGWWVKKGRSDSKNYLAMTPLTLGYSCHREKK
jgi:hypothetical protein